MKEPEYKKELHDKHKELVKVAVQKFQQRIKKGISDKEYERIKTEIADLPEFKACLELITEDPALEVFKSTKSFSIDKYQSFHKGALLNFLQRPLHQGEGFDAKDFEARYKKREACICPDKVDYKIIAYLTHSFESEAKEIKLGDGLKIKKLDEEEAKAVSEKERRRKNLSLGKYGVEIQGEFRCSPQADEEYPQTYFQNERDDILCSWAEEVCQKVIWALRLFKDADVSIPCLSLFWSPLISVYGYYTHFRVSPFRALTEYKLSQKEAIEFRNFWQRCHGLMDNATLNIALRRFGYAFERARPEDKLIDCVLGFESLFLKEKEHDYAKKISERMLKLLQNNKTALDSFSGRFRDLGIKLKKGEIQKRIQKELKLTYDLRSKIVHGWRAHEIDKKLKEFQEISDINLSIPLSDLERERSLKVPASKSMVYLREAIKETMHLFEKGIVKDVDGLIDYLDKI